MAILQKFGSEIWICDGPVVKAAMGFCYPTRMAVIRLSNDELWVWSPVALTDQIRSELAALGDVAYLVAPNHLHHIHLLDWAASYPQAQIFAAPRLAQKRADLEIDAELCDSAPSEWVDQIDQVVMTGNQITTEVIFFHRESQTVLVTDLLQQLPPDWFSGWRKWVARVDLMTEPQLSVPRKFRMAFRDRRAAKQNVARILQWPCERVIVAHGTPVSEGGHAVLQQAFSWLN